MTTHQGPGWQEPYRGAMAEPETLERFWLRVHGDRCVWRTARKDRQWCGECRDFTILKGDRYLDTGEFVGPWATAKCCASCAGKLAG